MTEEQVKLIEALLASGLSEEEINAIRERIGEIKKNRNIHNYCTPDRRSCQ